MIESVTVFLSVLMGCLALSTPISLAWASGTASLQMELLVHSLPKATSVGGVAAIVMAGFALTTTSARMAWILALAGSLILLANHLLGQNLSGFAPLTTLNYIDCIAGGVVLGGVLTAVRHRRMSLLVAVLGAMCAVMLGDLSVSDAEFTGSAGDSPLGWFVVDMPSIALIVPTTVLLVVCVYCSPGRRPDDQALSVELPLRPILAVLVLTAGRVIGSAWLVRDDSTPYDALPVALLAVLAALISALLLPHREGQMVLCAVAASATGGAIFLMPLTGWMVPLLLAVGAAGMVLAAYRPMPVAAVSASIGLAVVAVLTADADGPGPAVALTGALALSLLVGYSLASAVPTAGACALVLGLLVLCLPGVTVAVRARIFGIGFALPRRWEAPGGVRESEVVLFALPGLIALIITVGCLLALLLLRRLRPPAVLTPGGGAAAGAGAAEPDAAGDGAAAERGSAAAGRDETPT